MAQARRNPPQRLPLRIDIAVFLLTRLLQVANFYILPSVVKKTIFRIFRKNILGQFLPFLAISAPFWDKNVSVRVLLITLFGLEPWIFEYILHSVVKKNVFFWKNIFLGKFLPFLGQKRPFLPFWDRNVSIRALLITFCRLEL